MYSPRALFARRRRDNIAFEIFQDGGPRPVAILDLDGWVLPTKKTKGLKMKTVYRIILESRVVFL